MAKQGWRYTLPQPKSLQARWGNSDGRTTWWYGYWKNNRTNEYSSNKPTKKANGIFKGNGKIIPGIIGVVAALDILPLWKKYWQKYNIVCFRKFHL